MEWDNHNRSVPEHSVSPEEAHQITELSTLLVARIQEAKDTISDVESIFCARLYPNIKSKCKTLQEACSQARKAAEDSWNEKEKDFMLCIEKLQMENQKLIVENMSLKNSEMVIKQLLDCKQSLQLKIDELQREIGEETRKAKEAKELSDKLLDRMYKDASHIVDCRKQLEVQKRKSCDLTECLESSEKRSSRLEEELRLKLRELNEAKDAHEDLLRQIECQASKISNYELTLKAGADELKLQSIHLKQMNESVNELQGELEMKMKEIDAGKKLQQQLAREIDLKLTHCCKTERQLKEQESQNSMLLLKVEELEEKVRVLQVNLNEKISNEGTEEELYEKLLQCIEFKSTELTSERNKRQKTLSAYKRLKSQYNYLLGKTGFTSEGVPSDNTIQDKDNLAVDANNMATLTDFTSRNQQIPPSPSQASNSRTNGFVGTGLFRKGSGRKASPLAGTKRPASRWRQTRSHQNQDGPDPHDDFLGTPLKKIRGNLNSIMVEEVQDLPDPVPEEVNLSSPDNEMQKSTSPDPGKEQKQLRVPGSKGFKYVEPVRKKADRDNLKGVECKQCKKFYDAVLPNGSGNEKNMRCEHHEGVSRHRYRYAPPLTPEGFWNLGFDTEK